MNSPETTLPPVNPTEAIRCNASVVGKYILNLKDRADKDFTPLFVDEETKDVIDYLHADPAVATKVGRAAITRAFNMQDAYRLPSAH